MSLPWLSAVPLGALALWVMAGVGAGAAFSTLSASERRRKRRRELAVLGWRPARMVTLTVVVAVSAVGIGFVIGDRVGGGGLSSALAWSALTAIAATWAVPELVRTAAVSAQRRRVDEAVLMWLRRIRLFVAAGRPISVAVLDAAERVTEPAFAPAAGAVNAAVIGGRDPLAAVAAQLSDSPTAALLRTVDAAERSGAAASQLLDRVLDRVVRAIDDRRREAIDRLGRSLGAAASLLVVVASGMVMVTVFMTLPAL